MGDGGGGEHYFFLKLGANATAISINISDVFFFSFFFGLAADNNSWVALVAGLNLNTLLDEIVSCKLGQSSLNKKKANRNFGQSIIIQ